MNARRQAVRDQILRTAADLFREPRLMICLLSFVLYEETDYVLERMAVTQ